MSMEFSSGCTLVYPSFPNAYAMQCMPKMTFTLIHKVVNKTKENKFRTEDLIGSLIGTKFLDHHRTLI
jgi:hypothetical protein